MEQQSTEAAWTARSSSPLVIALLALTVAVAVASLFIGYAPLPARDVIDGLLNDQGTAGVIMREIRLPRMLLGAMAGAALGISGAALQGLLRNPLAEPGVMGISSFASLGAVIAIYFGLSTAFPYALPITAMIGALVAAALLAMLINLAPTSYAIAEIVYWLLGSLKDRSFDDFTLAIPFVVVGIAILATSGRALDALTLGEDAATSLGTDVAAIQRRITLGVALAVGASVAVTGAIAFVGLIVPHVCRPFVGHLPSRLLWPSAIGGALLVLVADVTVRVVPSGPELMLGVFTSLIGVPFFLWLVFRLRREVV